MHIFGVFFFFNIQFKSMAVKGLKIRFRMHNVIKYLSRNVAHQLYNTFIIRFYSNAFDEYCQIEAVTRKKINQCFDYAKRTVVFFLQFLIVSAEQWKILSLLFISAVNTQKKKTTQIGFRNVCRSFCLEISESNVVVHADDIFFFISCASSLFYNIEVG